MKALARLHRCVVCLEVFASTNLAKSHELAHPHGLYRHIDIGSYRDERSRHGEVDKSLVYKPGVAGSIPGLTNLSDETLSFGPVSI